MDFLRIHLEDHNLHVINGRLFGKIIPNVEIKIFRGIVSIGDGLRVFLACLLKFFRKIIVAIREIIVVIVEASPIIRLSAAAV